MSANSTRPEFRVSSPPEPHLTAPVDQTRLAAAGPDLLRARRIQRAVTVEQVAARLGVHPNTVLQWERRARLPGPAHIRGLAECLGLEQRLVAGFFDEARARSSPAAASLRTPGLRALRTGAGLSAAQLAAAAGVPPGTVYRWESGATPMPEWCVAVVARALDRDEAAVRSLLSTRPPAARAQVHPLRRLRRRTGLSQTAVAERIGASRHSVSAWENGHQPPLGAVRRLAAVYGVPVSAVARAARLEPPPLLDRSRWRPGDLPQVLWTLRQWTGLSQSEVALRLGCSTDAVRGWERGRSTPSPAMRARLEQAHTLPEGALLTAYP